MKILGIDPGTDIVGVAIVVGTPNSPELEWMESVKLMGKTKAERLNFLGLMVSNNGWDVDAIALESGYVGPNRKTSLTIAEARGVVMAYAAGQKCRVVEVSPSEAKQSVTGKGNADKATVRRCVIAMFPKMAHAGENYYDATDAAAVAIAGMWKVEK